MRQSIAPGRMSMAGPRSTTGISNRFSTQPVDFKRYCIGNTGSVQRQKMAPPRLVNRDMNQVKSEQARSLEQFFKDNGALFQFPFKEIRDGASRNSFRAWFEFLIKTLNRNYELPDTNNAINEEVPAVMHCLNYYPPIKSSNMSGLNAPHQWPAFLTMLDWLRKLSIIDEQDHSIGIETQEYTFKYAFDCYKQAKGGDDDFSQIFAAMRELIICNSSYDNLNTDIKRAQETIDDHESKFELEHAAIAQVEKEIADSKQEIESLANAENELTFSMTAMNSKIDETDSEIKAMEEKIRLLKAENEALNKQVNSQPVSAYEARELLQKRNNLRDEHKEKKDRHEKLYAIQAEKSKSLSKIASEKAESYRAFYKNLAQSAKNFGAQDSYRKLEIALFGSEASDSLRAEKLVNEATEMFRLLMNAIRVKIQERLDEINQERLDTQLRHLDNENRMTRQQIQQIEQKNQLELNDMEIENQEAELQLKQVEKDYELTVKHHDEAVKQNAILNSRAETQSTSMKQLEVKLSSNDIEEAELLNQFADYMVEASARFDSFSKQNGDLIRQKEMLLELTAKVIDHIKKLMDSIPTSVIKPKESIVPSLDDLDI